MNPKPLTVLAIDDDSGDAELLRRNLEEVYGSAFEFVHSASPEQAREILARQDVDITFLDYHLGARTGLDLLRAIRASGDMRPLVVLTGCGDEYAAARLAREGADDYIAKRDLSPGVLRRAIEEARTRYHQRKSRADFERQREMLTRLIVEANAEFARRSRLDPLTKLLNRVAWAEAAAAEHRRALRYGHPYAVLMLDIDYFKNLNDSLGHPAGDRALQEVARCLMQGCRADDLVARYGGEEFVVLAIETGIAGARVCAEQLRASVWSARIEHPASPVADRVTVSIGVAVSPAARWEDVLEQADQALYDAKRQGRNRVCCRPPPAPPPISIRRQSP